MSEDAFGPGLNIGDFLGDAARSLLNSGGGAEAKQMQAEFSRRAELHRAMAARIARVFATKDGEAVLDWLVDNTLRRDVVPVEFLLSHTPDQVQAYSLVRAGENSIAKLILEAIAQSKNKRSRMRKAT